VVVIIFRLCNPVQNEKARVSPGLRIRVVG
jgi:hypothetical protein